MTSKKLTVNLYTIKNVFLENYNFNEYVKIYSNEEYSDDYDEKNQINKIKCIDLYLEKTN